MPDETPLEQINETLDELLVGLMKDEVQLAFDMTSNKKSIIFEEPFDKYLDKTENKE